MNIQLTDIEIKNLGHLLKSLSNQQFNFCEIKTFLEKLEQKLNSAPVTEKRSRKKQTRKNLFHSMLLNNVHGNRKKIV